MNTQRCSEAQVVAQEENFELVSNSTQDELAVRLPACLLPSLSLLAFGYWDELLKNGIDVVPPLLRPDLGGW